MRQTVFEKRFHYLMSSLDESTINKITPLFTIKFHQKSNIQSYKPTLFVKVLTELSDSQNDETVLLCKKLLLLGAILNNWESFEPLQRKGEYKDYLKRIFKATRFNDQVSLRSPDVFWKDLAIARLQIFPIKAGVVEYYSGFSLRQGLSFNILNLVRFLVFALKFGRKPYYRTHLHTPVIDNFSELGWEKSYHQIAELLKRNKCIKGLVRTSWYFDPKIKVISPHLSYLQDLPLQNGAQQFCVGPDETGCALLKSKSRFLLYDEGHYKPMNYLIVWPRDAVISWSEMHKEFDL